MNRLTPPMQKPAAIPEEILVERFHEDFEPVIKITQEDLQGDEDLYYLLKQGAPADEPVETITAHDLLEASEAFLLPEIAASIPFPPYRRGRPSRPNAPPMQAAVTEDGRGYLIGKVDWPEGVEMTHGALWSTFNQREIEYVKEVWEHLRTDPARSPRPPYPGEKG